MLFMATADPDGRCAVSPRGGVPGFVAVLDEQRLAFADVVGNNLIDSLTHIVANPHVGLLFVIPGRDETLRVEGRAWITTDPDVLARVGEPEGKPPKVAIGVEVTSTFIHCSRSFERGHVLGPRVVVRARRAERQGPVPLPPRRQPAGRESRRASPAALGRLRGGGREPARRGPSLYWRPS